MPNVLIRVHWRQRPGSAMDKTIGHPGLRDFVPPSTQSGICYPKSTDVHVTDEDFATFTDADAEAIAMDAANGAWFNYSRYEVLAGG